MVVHPASWCACTGRLLRTTTRDPKAGTTTYEQEALLVGPSGGDEHGDTIAPSIRGRGAHLNRPGPKPTERSFRSCAEDLAHIGNASVKGLMQFAALDDSASSVFGRLVESVLALLTAPCSHAETIRPGPESREPPPRSRHRQIRIEQREGCRGDTGTRARDEMLDLAERLAELNDEQWNSPSLCAQWRIRDVLAHVTAGAEGAFGVGCDLPGNASPRLQLQPMGGS